MLELLEANVDHVNGLLVANSTIYVSDTRQRYTSARVFSIVRAGVTAEVNKFIDMGRGRVGQNVPLDEGRLKHQVFVGQTKCCMKS